MTKRAALTASTLFVGLAFPFSVSGQTLIKDINELPPTGNPSGEPSALVTIQGVLYYSSVDAAHGREPWVSDGTTAGTRLLVDVNPGIAHSNPGPFVELDDGVIVFAASSVAAGRELWKTDGTPPGTTLLKDVRPGEIGSSPYGLTSFQGFVYFVADDGVHGFELWRTDGTAAGTSIVADAVAGANGISTFGSIDTCSTPYALFAADLFGQGLWRSDGTAAGTVLLSPTAKQVQELTALGDKVLFSAIHPAYGRELWVSDGTAAGTSVLVDLDASADGDPRDLLRHGSQVYFSAHHPAIGRELFRTDGSANGTVAVADVQPGPYGSDPQPLATLGSHVIFRAAPFATGPELWATDGTPSGTALIADAVPGSSGSEPVGGVVVGSEFFYSGVTPFGRELIATNGTAAGTRVVADVNPAGGSNPTALTAFGNGVLFSAFDGAHGIELWATDGTTAGTRLVIDSFPKAKSVSSNPDRVVAVLDRIYFRANDGTHGPELWVSDGSGSGTRLVVDLLPGDLGSDPSSLTPLGDRLFFVARDDLGFEPWITDGTAAGTARLADVFAGPGDSAWGEIPVAVLGDRVYFAATSSGPTFQEIWMSDGTPQGTMPLHHVDPQAASISVAALHRHRDDLYVYGFSFNPFFAKLYRTNGGANGLTELLDSSALGVSFAQIEFASHPDALFFILGKSELWRTDGTPVGTRRVRLFAGGQVEGLVVVNDQVLFRANDGLNGVRVWSSDGTTAGTMALADTGAGMISEIEPNGDTGLFAVTAGLASTLWKTDGSPAGTSPFAMVSAIGDFPEEIELVQIGSGPEVALSASALGIGRELWTTNGTAAGTALAVEIATGAFSSRPSQFVRLGHRLVFVANDGQTGVELHAVPIVELGAHVAESFGAGCAGRAGAIPVLGLTGDAKIGGTVSIELASAAPNAAALLLVGTGAIELPLGAGCALAVEPPFVAVPWTTDATGTAVARATLPASLLGTRFVLQALIADVGSAIGFTGTAGFEVVVGP